MDKHPHREPAHSEFIVQEEPQPAHSIIFESLDALCIRAAALRTDGAAGPSGVDGKGWRRLCTSFRRASDELCNSLAATARRLCTCLVDRKSISALMAGRLIALNKNPGVRPIGIGETLRRIIAKAILPITKADVQSVAGTLQLCTEQISGVEAAIHSVRNLWSIHVELAALVALITSA